MFDIKLIKGHFLILFILCVIILNVMLTAASCCTNPNAPSAIVCTGTVTQSECCADDNIYCQENQYHPSDDCSSLDECTVVGCCCGYDVVGNSLADIKTEAGCNGLFVLNNKELPKCINYCALMAGSVSNLDEQCVYSFDGTSIDYVGSASDFFGKNIKAATRKQNVLYVIGADDTFMTYSLPSLTITSGYLNVFSGMSADSIIYSPGTSSWFASSSTNLYAISDNEGDGLWDDITTSTLADALSTPIAPVPTPATADAIGRWGDYLALASNSERLFYAYHDCKGPYCTSLSVSYDALPFNKIDAMFEYNGILYFVTDCSCKHIKYFGPAFSSYEGYGDNFDQISSYSNIVHVGSGSKDVSHIITHDINKINQAKAKGMKSILHITSIFYDVDIVGGKLSVELFPDYAVRWNQYATAIQPYLDDIYGIYLVDEPYWILTDKNRVVTPLSISEVTNWLETAASEVKGSFPDTDLIAGFNNYDDLIPIYGSIPIPSYADKVLYYYYWTDRKPKLGMDMSQWIKEEEASFTILQSEIGDREIILLPGAYKYDLTKTTTITVTPTDSELISLAGFWYQKALKNPNIEVFLPFVYNSLDPKTIGFKHMPSVHQKYKEIGEEILSCQS